MMADLDPLLLAGAKAKGKRPYFLDQDIERLTNVVLVLVQELAVTRTRLDTVERLLQRAGAITQSEIDGFEPTKPEADERGAWTQEYLARVFRILQQEREAISQPADLSSEEVAEELAKV